MVVRQRTIADDHVLGSRATAADPGRSCPGRPGARAIPSLGASASTDAVATGVVNRQSCDRNIDAGPYIEPVPTNKHVGGTNKQRNVSGKVKNCVQEVGGGGWCEIASIQNIFYDSPTSIPIRRSIP